MLPCTWCGAISPAAVMTRCWLAAAAVALASAVARCDTGNVHTLVHRIHGAEGGSDPWTARAIIRVPTQLSDETTQAYEALPQDPGALVGSKNGASSWYELMLVDGDTRTFTKAAWDAALTAPQPIAYTKSVRAAVKFVD